MKVLLLVIVSIFSSCPAISVARDALDSVQNERPEVAENVRAYEGTEGEIVWVLRYGKPEDSKMLVQITGIDHPWNKQIQVMDVEDTGTKKYVYRLIDGRRFNVLFFSENGRATLTLPGGHKSQPVFYSSDYSSEGNAQHFLTDYLESKK